MKKLIFVFITLIICLCMVSCDLATIAPSLKGEKGDTGAVGPAGPAGMNGVNGKDGADGKDGKDGKDGENGLSAYQLAVLETGYAGTIKQWLSSLKGEKGDAGRGIKKIELKNNILNIYYTDAPTTAISVGELSVPACTHKFSAWTIQKGPTCTSTGYQTRKCTVCSVMEYDIINQTSHIYSSNNEYVLEEATTTKMGAKLLICNKCSTVTFVKTPVKSN